MALRKERAPQKSEKSEIQKKTKKKKPVTASKVFFIIIIAILVLVILFCGVLIGLSKYLNKIDRVNPDVDIISPENQDFEVDDPDNIDPSLTETDADSIEWWETENLQDDHLVNIMLVGQDTRGSTRERSDTMILCSINPDTGEVAVISFLRDLYVQIPGYYDNRMNAAYAFGGFPLLYEVMQVNFGITIDGGIEVNFESFKDIVDLIGGVDIELTASEARIVGVYEGVNHLNGEQALTYARIRKIDSDFGRTNRQRTVLNAILNKVRHLPIKDLLALVDSCLGYVTTDMTNSQIIDVAMVALPLLPKLELQSYRIPTDDAYYLTMIRGMSVLVPDLKLNQQYLKEDFLPLS